MFWSRSKCFPLKRISNELRSVGNTTFSLGSSSFKGNQALQMNFALKKSGINNSSGFDFLLGYLPDIKAISAQILLPDNDHSSPITLHTQLTVRTNTGQKIQSKVIELKPKYWTPIFWNVDSTSISETDATELQVRFFIISGTYTGTVYIDDLAIYTLKESKLQGLLIPTMQPTKIIVSLCGGRIVYERKLLLRSKPLVLSLCRFRVGGVVTFGTSLSSCLISDTYCILQS